MKLFGWQVGLGSLGVGHMGFHLLVGPIYIPYWVVVVVPHSRNWLHSFRCLEESTEVGDILPQCWQIGSDRHPVAILDRFGGMAMGPLMMVSLSVRFGLALPDNWAATLPSLARMMGGAASPDFPDWWDRGISPLGDGSIVAVCVFLPFSLVRITLVFSAVVGVAGDLLW